MKNKIAIIIVSIVVSILLVLLISISLVKCDADDSDEISTSFSTEELVGTEETEVIDITETDGTNGATDDPDVVTDELPVTIGGEDPEPDETELETEKLPDKGDEEGTTTTPEPVVTEPPVTTTKSPVVTDPVVTTTSETTTSEPPAPEVTEGTTTKYSISDPDYDPNDLPDLGGEITPEEKEKIEQDIACCKHCGQSRSLYHIHSVFGGECPHCGENITANVCHDCVRDGQTPAW